MSLLILKKSKVIHFVSDTVEIKNDIPDGKREFHVIAMTVFQKSCDKKVKAL